MIKVYISGPMSIDPHMYQSKFDAAADQISALDFAVSNPADIARYNPGQTWEWYMRQALKMMLECHRVVLLPNWEDSRGAKLELLVASELLMPAITLEALLLNLPWRWAWTYYDELVAP